MNNEEKCMSQKHICPLNSDLFLVLQQLYPNCSKTSLRSWIKLGRVYVDNVVVKNVQVVVKAGQTIEISDRKHMVDSRLPILYTDSALVVIDKPEGLLSVSTFFEKTETAFGLLKRHFYPKQVYVVHRLDQATSGVMLFALSEKALASLKKTFAAHEIERKYVAIVEGVLEESQGKWESYLYEDRNYVVKETSNPSEGELAVTHYRLIAHTKTHSWLELSLETGKKNQIRVHCQKAGHPVVGDKKYGATGNPAKRLCLHANYLAFKHPISGKSMQFTSPVPDSFYRLVKPS